MLTTRDHTHLGLKSSRMVAEQIAPSSHPSCGENSKPANEINDKKVMWRPREDSNLRPQDSYHFGFRRRPKTFVVWTVPSPWTEVFRCCPSSLYTFTGSSPALGSGLACRSGKRSPTLSRSVMEFPAITPNFRNPVLFSHHTDQYRFILPEFTAQSTCRRQMRGLDLGCSLKLLGSGVHV